METNRDLYVFIAELTKRRRSDGLALELYLGNLRALAGAHAQRRAMALPEFAAMLEAAFEPVSTSPVEGGDAGYLEFCKTLDKQIQDLRDMKAAGILDDEYRYFGVNAPGGGRWYNFDPCTYLECATAGTFDGWQEGDDTGRDFVPGEVAVLDASGAVVGADPRTIERSIDAIPEVDWEVGVEFLWAGQCYE